METSFMKSLARPLVFRTKDSGKELAKYWKRTRDSLWLEPLLTSKEKSLLADLISRTSMDPRPWVWFSSSGSTSDGGLKFFAHTRESLTAAARGANQHLRTSSEDVVVNFLPLFHVGGFSTWLRSELGGYTWKHRPLKKWSPSKAWEVLNSEEATLTSLVPTQIHDLVSLNLTAPRSLRAVIIGGGKLDSDLYRKARALGWLLLPSYGMTELGSQVATASLKSVNLDEVFVEDSDSYTLTWLPHITQIQKCDGKWRIQSPACATLKVQISPEKAFSLELFQRNGEVFVEDELIVDGKNRTLQALGRKDEVVKVKGELVSLNQLTSKLESYVARFFDGTLEFEICNFSHPRLENELVLFLEQKGLFEMHPHFLKIQKLLKEFNSQQKPWERIVRVEWLPQFTRSPLGKVKKNLLASQFEDCCLED
ncbi:MAG TPA: hypothetical protein DCL41_00650 [Bdellovibrionales bacterium]|nr:hypothetical protein [Bdellovibrionales bacterium]